MSARAKRASRSDAPATGTYSLTCQIKQQGTGTFLAIVTAVPGGDCPPSAKPESESRFQKTREDAFRACAEMGFAMESRLLRMGYHVRGWPPRPASNR